MHWEQTNIYAPLKTNYTSPQPVKLYKKCWIEQSWVGLWLNARQLDNLKPLRPQRDVYSSVTQKQLNFNVSSLGGFRIVLLHDTLKLRIRYLSSPPHDVSLEILLIPPTVFEAISSFSLNCETFILLYKFETHDTN